MTKETDFQEIKNTKSYQKTTSISRSIASILHKFTPTLSRWYNKLAISIVQNIFEQRQIWKAGNTKSEHFSSFFWKFWGVLNDNTGKKIF